MGVDRRADWCVVSEKSWLVNQVGDVIAFTALFKTHVVDCKLQNLNEKHFK